MTNKIEPGCWIKSKNYGLAICTDVSDGGWVSLRYEAVRQSDQKTIWVANGDRIENCEWDGFPNAVSRVVAKMTGPYGDG